MLKYKIVYLGIDCYMLAFVVRNEKVVSLTTGKPSLSGICLDSFPAPVKCCYRFLTSKARSSKHGLENSKETSSNVLVDKNIQSLKSE